MARPLWVVLTLATAALVWLAFHVDGAPLRDSYRMLLYQTGRVLTLLILASVLVELQCAAFQDVAREVSIPFTTAGWLLVSVLLIIFWRSPRAP